MTGRITLVCFPAEHEFFVHKVTEKVVSYLPRSAKRSLELFRSGQCGVDLYVNEICSRTLYTLCSQFIIVDTYDLIILSTSGSCLSLRSVVMFVLTLCRPTVNCI